MGVLKLDIVVAGARTRKDLRAPVASIRDRLRARFSVSCHEIENRMRPARSVLVVTTAGNDPAVLRSILDSADHVARMSGVVSSTEVDVFRWPTCDTMWQPQHDDADWE